MRVNAKNNQRIEINGAQVEEVEEFVYLGALVYGHFAPWSFRPQSLRPNQKSVRPIIEVTSPHT